MIDDDDDVLKVLHVPLMWITLFRYPKGRHTKKDKISCYLRMSGILCFIYFFSDLVGLDGLNSFFQLYDSIILWFASSSFLIGIGFSLRTHNLEDYWSFLENVMSIKWQGIYFIARCTCIPPGIISFYRSLENFKSCKNSLIWDKWGFVFLKNCMPFVQGFSNDAFFLIIIHSLKTGFSFL